MLFDEMAFDPYQKGENKARMAYELYENGQISQALVELEEAIEIDPSNSAWHFNKALALDAVGQFEDAIKEYEISLELNPFDTEILNSLAVDYTRTGQYDLAINVFEHIQELDPAFEPAYCNRIITYTEMDQHDLAEQMFYLGQQINPDCALCYYNIGNNLFVRTQYKKAIGCWERTAEIEPSHPQINYRIAQAYWYEGDHDKARQYFLNELRINPGDIDVILDFGLFLLEAGQLESAKEKFNRIIELKPDFAPALFYLGEITFDNKDYESAIELFNQAMQMDSEPPQLIGPRHRLAQYALMTGNKEKARAYLISELDLDPEDSNILVSMASMFLKVDNIDLAIHCLLKSLENDCSNPDAYYYLGCVRTIQVQFEEAAEFFGHALDINPNHINTLRDSSLVCLAMGKLKQASGRIKKAKSLASDDSQLTAISRRVYIVALLKRIINVISKPSGIFRKLLR